MARSKIQRARRLKFNPDRDIVGKIFSIDHGSRQLSEVFPKHESSAPPPNLLIQTEEDLVAFGADTRIIEGYRYWKLTTPTGVTFPGRQHFDPTDIPKLLRYIILVDVEYPGPRFRYRVFPTEWRNAVGRDFSGLYIDDPSIRDVTHFVEYHYNFVVEKRIPSYRAGPPSLCQNEDYPMLQRLNMPLARDGDVIDQILGVSIVPHRFTGSALATYPVSG